MKRIDVLPAASSVFSKYGSVASLPGGATTAEGPNFKYWSDVASFHVEGEAEIGYCTVYAQTDAVIDWMEKHENTPEILVPIDAPFVLPVMGPGDEIEAFRVETGEAAVIDRAVWHSACIPAESDAATYLVIFRRGTPAEDVIKTDVPPVEVAL